MGISGSGKEARVSIEETRRARLSEMLGSPDPEVKSGGFDYLGSEVSSEDEC